MLALDLNTVVSPMFDNWLDAVVPAPALFNFLPQWMPGNNQMTQLAATLQAVMAQIAAFQAVPNGPDTINVTAWIALVAQINKLVDSFPTLAWAALGPAVKLYDTLVAQLDALLKKIDADRLAVMGPLLAELKADVMKTTMACTRLDDLWDKLDPAFDQNPPPGTLGAFYPPEGNYYPLSPYYPLADILNVPPSPPATPDFVAELKNTTDSAVLAQALADLTGPLSQAGVSPVWPAPPVFAPNADANAIIQQM